MGGPPPNIKIYNTASEIMTVWHWWGDRHLEQNKEPVTDPHQCGLLTKVQKQFNGDFSS